MQNAGIGINEQKEPTGWNTLVEDFRRFGGIANNLTQRKGPLGLGLFPIDSSQPVELRVPDHLLVAVDNIELRDGAVVIKDPSDYPEGFSNWYERFQADYSWGAEARLSIKSFEDGLKSLPDSLQQRLQKLGLLNANKRYPGINEEQELFQRFIATRQINRNGSMVLMPMIELVNHSPTQSSWIMDKDSIAIQKQYDKEILVRYSVSDPIRRCIQYGFNCKEPLGFSLDFYLIHNNQKILVNGGINYCPFEPLGPIFHGDTVVINKPLLGSLNTPRLPKKLFKQNCNNIANVDAYTLFDQIHRLNRIALINILRELEKFKQPAACLFKTAILDQIEILSQHYGTKEDNIANSQDAT